MSEVTKIERNIYINEYKEGEITTISFNGVEEKDYRKYMKHNFNIKEEKEFIEYLLDTYKYEYKEDKDTYEDKYKGISYCLCWYVEEEDEEEEENLDGKMDEIMWPLDDLKSILNNGGEDFDFECFNDIDYLCDRLEIEKKNENSN